jgi:hypothetical protein
LVGHEKYAVARINIGLCGNAAIDSGWLRHTS